MDHVHVHVYSIVVGCGFQQLAGRLLSFRPGTCTCASKVLHCMYMYLI